MLTRFLLVVVTSLSSLQNSGPFQFGRMFTNLHSPNDLIASSRHKSSNFLEKYLEKLPRSMYLSEGASVHSLFISNNAQCKYTSSMKETPYIAPRSSS
uniref:Secreted protein n=1 Tax=Amphimedon queenslandica TaxID=400682 RepID=A0A1X7U8Y0_AMPQE